MTKTLMQFALVIGTMISLYFLPWPIVFAWLEPLPDTIQAQVNDTQGYGFDGVIVYTQRERSKPKWFTAGWHNRQTKEPVRNEALFKIASVGKLYDAVAIVKLVKAGSVSLDDTLEAHFPELASRIANADKITIRHLVKHRSGIANYTDHPEYWVNPPQSELATLELVFDRPALFTPDDDYHYSNTNYLLLSMLIERVSGLTKFEYIQSTILEPLSLNDTLGSIDAIDLNTLMSGYYVGIEHDIKSTNYGSMVATASDLGQFIRALNDGSLFTEQERELYGSLYEFGHTGLIPGYQTIARFHKDIDTVVIQFTNTTDFNGYHWSLSEIGYDRTLTVYRKQLGNKSEIK